MQISSYAFTCLTLASIIYLFTFYEVVTRRSEVNFENRHHIVSMSNFQVSPSL